jgi:hypothetical protein
MISASLTCDYQRRVGLTGTLGDKARLNVFYVRPALRIY